MTDRLTACLIRVRTVELGKASKKVLAPGAQASPAVTSNKSMGQVVGAKKK